MRMESQDIWSKTIVNCIYLCPREIVIYTVILRITKRTTKIWIRKSDHRILVLVSLVLQAAALKPEFGVCFCVFISPWSVLNTQNLYSVLANSKHMYHDFSQAQIYSMYMYNILYLQKTIWSFTLAYVFSTSQFFWIFLFWVMPILRHLFKWFESVELHGKSNQILESHWGIPLYLEMRTSIPMGL